MNSPGWLFVPGMGDLNWELKLPWGGDTEVWVTVSGKPSQRPSSWRGWKTRAWIGLLSTTISFPSRAARIAEKWISSLPVSLVNRSLLQENRKVPPTNGGSGKTSSRSFAMYDPESSCWRTCQASLLQEVSEKYSDPWPVSGSMRSGVCTARGRSEHPTVGIGSSYSRGEYPTPSSTPYGSSQNEGEVPHDRPSRGTPSLETWSKQWPTARAEDSECCGSHRGAIDSLDAAQKNWAGSWPTPNTRDSAAAGRHSTTTGVMHSGTTLTDAMRQWPTPKTCRGGTEGKESRAKRGAGGADLVTEAANWPTPQARDYKGSDVPNRRGTPSLPEVIRRQKPGQKPVLNPAFVTVLQGLPTGWINFEPLETALFRAWQHWHSLIF